jgi:hypothetical protein
MRRYCAWFTMPGSGRGYAAGRKFLGHGAEAGLAATVNSFVAAWAYVHAVFPFSVFRFLTIGLKHLNRSGLTIVKLDHLQREKTLSLESDGAWDHEALESLKEGDKWRLGALGLKKRLWAIFLEFALPLCTLFAISCLIAIPALSHDTHRREGPSAPGDLSLGNLSVGRLTIGSVVLPDPEPPLKWSEAIAGSLALFGLLIGFFQWRDGRHEASLEKYYERLDLANQRMEAICAQRQKEQHILIFENNANLAIMTAERTAKIISHGLEPAHVWVFTEVDNLEYVLAKYQLGYASKAMVGRALDTFSGRCECIQHFSKNAQAAVCRDVGSGFLPITQRVVHVLVQRAALAKKPLH